MAPLERTYTLIIGRPVYLKDKVVNIEKYTNTNQGEAYEIKGLHIQFDIKKDNSKDPNKGYVTVYNLSDEVVNYLTMNQKESLAVMFLAGYNNDEKMVFSGTTEWVEDKFNEETRETKFILGDASLNITTATTARSYRSGTPVATIVNDLVTDLKVPKGRILPMEGETISHSMAFTGTASQNLANLAKNTGSTFSVQDGAAYWTKEGSRFNQVMFEISEEGGMVGSPNPKQPSSSKRARREALKKTTAKTKSSTTKSKASKVVKEDWGLEVTTLLNGAILPESTVYVKSRTHTGFYKVVQLSHKGGYESGDWVTVLGLTETRGTLIS